MYSEIIKYEERLRLAMINDDCKELDELLSDDMKFISHMGEVITKQDDINAHKDSLFSIINITFRSQSISSLSDMLSVISDVDLTLSTPAGIIKDHLIYSRLWKKDSNGYKVVFGQASLVN